LLPLIEKGDMLALPWLILLGFPHYVCVKFVNPDPVGMEVQ